MVLRLWYDSVLYYGLMAAFLHHLDLLAFLLQDGPGDYDRYKTAHHLYAVLNVELQIARQISICSHIFVDKLFESKSLKAHCKAANNAVEDADDLLVVA
jgi:hypothetical protein